MEELMLIKELIRKTLPMQGFRIKKVITSLNKIQIQIETDKRYKRKCSKCGSAGKYRDRRPVREFKHVPLWGIDVYLYYSPVRINCPECKSVVSEHIPWAAGKKRMTEAFTCFIASWARVLTWLEVSRIFKCSWGLVSSAVKHVVTYGLLNKVQKPSTLIGIDEISRRKGHVYLTNVYDLDSKTLIWSGEKRTKETLNNFFDNLGPLKISKLKGICCDMWQPYIDKVRERASNAILVFDKFHIVRYLTKAVDEVRRQEIRDKGKDHKELMKNTRYIWLKNPWNLSENQKNRLGNLEKLNLKINRAYLLKEAFRKFWSYKKKGWAEKYLKKWFWWATHSRLEPLRDFAWLLRRHEENILSILDMPIHNGTVEGLNNKAKVISHKAYGFRSAKTYMLNLYHCMGDLPMPEQKHSFI
jgi:transposase